MKSATERLKASTDKRILNEFSNKTLNEDKIIQVTVERASNQGLPANSHMLLHCECDNKTCTKMISISTEDYSRVHHKTKQFIVVNEHICRDIEKVIKDFGPYTLVEKFFPHDR